MKKIIFLCVLSLCLFLTACANAITQSEESISSSKTESSVTEKQEVSEQSKQESEVSKVTTSTPTELYYPPKSEIKPSDKKNKNNLYGVAFLGYESDEGEITPPFAFISMEQFKQMESVMYEGDEYYLIVPISKGVKVEIFAFNSNDPIGGIGECLYQSDSGVPILLRCNLSDIRVNTAIRFENKDLFANYSPAINLMDGSVIIDKGGYLLKPIETPTENGNTTNEEIDNCIYMLNEYLTEEFAVEYYDMPEYTKQSIFIDGQPTDCIIPDELIGINEEIPDDYIHDPFERIYYPVYGFSDMNELITYFKDYFTQSYMEEIEFTLRNNFIDFDGTLYLIRGGVGYGAITLDFDSIDYSNVETSNTVLVDKLFFGEKDGTFKITFDITEGALKISNVEEL